jgi:hypothetical protein
VPARRAGARPDEDASAHDFGRDCSPRSARAEAAGLRLPDEPVSRGARTQGLWRDIGTVVAYWEANRTERGPSEVQPLQPTLADSHGADPRSSGEVRVPRRSHARVASRPTACFRRRHHLRRSHPPLVIGRRSASTRSGKSRSRFLSTTTSRGATRASVVRSSTYASVGGGVESATISRRTTRRFYVSPGERRRPKRAR